MNINEIREKLTDTGHPDLPVYVSLSDGKMDTEVISVVIAPEAGKCVIFAQRPK